MRPQSCSAERIASATGSASVSCTPRFPCSRRDCARPEWARATASPAICPTCPRRSSRCSPPRASARSGRPRPRTSECRASWTASARLRRRCCSARTATSTAASGSTPSADWGRSWRGFRRSSASSSCRTPPRHLTHPRWTRPSPSMNSWPARSPPRSSSSASLSTIRSTSCIPREPRGPRSASCTARAGRSSSTSRSWRCTAT